MKIPPIVVLVGTSGAGKTTFLEKLVKELKKRSLRVATIKHHGHDFEIDTPGKDTWRHSRAGADAVAISSPTKFAVIRKVEREMGIDEAAAFFTDADIIIVEGYKKSTKPKIEICRRAHSEKLLSTPDNLLAVVSDMQWDIGVPVFELEDAAGIAALLAKTFDL